MLQSGCPTPTASRYIRDGWRSLRPSDMALRSCHRFFEDALDLIFGESADSFARNGLDDREDLAGTIDATGGGVRFGGGIKCAQGDSDGFIFVQFLERLSAPMIFVIQNSAHGRRPGTGSGVIGRLELRAHRIIKIKPRFRFR